MTDTTLISLQPRSECGLPLYVQISDTIRQKIILGSLSPGALLPSSRNLALEIGVSRTSVIAAYEQLKAEGYLSSKRGSGVRVNPIGNLELIGGSTADKPGRFVASQPSDRSNQTHPSLADMRLFPHRQWGRCVSKVARKNPQLLVESTDPFGDPELRRSISVYLSEWRGMSVSPEQIIVTAGSIDALELVLRTLVSARDLVGLENPGYLPLRNFVDRLGMKIVWMPVDGEGARVPKRKPVKMAIITPSHQFPLGGAMSPGRRMKFIAWSRKSGGWIVEDDYDSEFRYAGKPIQALAGLDNMNRSIYIGSFAKIFSNGLRLGFLVVPQDLGGSFREALGKFSTKASISMQRPLSEFMNGGEFYRHIRRVRRIYDERRQLLLNGLRDELGDRVSFQDFQAGMQLAVRLPEWLDDTAVAEAARRRGVSVSPLSKHYSEGPPEQGLLIGFCAYNPREIQYNVAVLKSVIKTNGTT